MTQLSTIQQINSSIMFGDLTNTQLDSIINAVKYARAQLGKQTKNSVQIGTRVSFVDSRRGIKHIGDVTKIAIKYISVRTNSGVWKVPANMITVEEMA